LKVGIIGANGFIGTRLTEQLYLTRFAEVRAIVRSYTALAGLSRLKIDYRIADGFDSKALLEAFVDCEVVVHCIAGNSETILGTIEPVYSAAQKAGVQRLIYLSSAMVHGQMPAPGTNEESHLDPRQMLPFNNAKVRAEKLLLKLRKKGRVEIVILRPGIVFGPRSTWIIKFISDLLKGDAFLINDGKGICNSIYIDNLIHAIKLAISEEDIDQNTFLLKDAEQITWADLYRPLTEYFGYDFQRITNIQPPFYITEGKDLLYRIKNTKLIKSVSSPVPKNYLISNPDASLSIEHDKKKSSQWRIPAEGNPTIDLERLLLYQCDYALPWKKAYKYLNYEPVFSFIDAMQRTIAWMEFAGYESKKKPKLFQNTHTPGIRIVNDE